MLAALSELSKRPFVLSPSHDGAKHVALVRSDKAGLLDTATLQLLPVQHMPVREASPHQLLHASHTTLAAPAVAAHHTASSAAAAYKRRKTHCYNT